MIATKKSKLIRKHLGANTPEWVVKNCIELLKEYEETEWCGVAESQANGVQARDESALPIQNVSGISIADINDAPMFTHTKQFREHFDYIKSEFVRLLSYR